MKALNILTIRSAIVGVVLCLTVAGCGKQEDSEPAPTPQTAAPTDTVAPVEQRSQPPAARTTSAEPQQWMSEAKTYQKAGDYDRAAENLLLIQQQQNMLNQQQVDAYWKQMENFQADIMQRAAEGDPSAKAAISRLRASNRR